MGKEEILKSNSIQIERLKQEKPIFLHKILKAMDDYSEQQGDLIHELHTKPQKALKPLEDLWRKENSPDKFVLPDTTEFFKWIVSKIIKHSKKLNNDLLGNVSVKCEHPYWAVNTKCLGEINHCTKCGKDL